jgi:RNA polymerase sigma-70 factor (ECF subfamily)
MASVLSENIKLDEPQPEQRWLRIETDEQQLARLWEGLYRDYRPRIYSYLASRLDPDLAEDLTQETFLKAGVALSKMTGELLVSPWLYRIATNLVNDLLRHRRLIAWQSLDLWEEEREMEYPDLVGADPAEWVVDDDCVQAALLQLPDGYRQALLLTACEGYSPLQVAEAVGIAPSGGKMYVSRARKRFRCLYIAASFGLTEN